MKKIFTTVLLLATIMVSGQQRTVQEKLGYPKETKLLIIHADDMGVLTSLGSIMVPCPWFPEIASYATEHPDADLGLHLTLTSEWKTYKWPPVLHNEVKSLMTDKGFLTDGSVDLGKTAKADEVEKELRAQIERAIQFGIKPTHFDSHMAVLFQHPEFLKIYIKLGREYKVPVLLNAELEKAWFGIDLAAYVTEKDIVTDKVFMALPDNFSKGMKNYYTDVLKSIKPGLNCILLHAAYDDAEMKAVTMDHDDYGAAWRQADFDFFTSDECRKLIKEQGITLITWKEIRDKVVK